MTKAEFLDTLRRRLAGLPRDEIDELVGDYATHFADGMAEGRNESEIAQALGDPMRLARELRAEAGFRRWEEARTPANFFAVLFGLLGYRWPARPRSRARQAYYPRRPNTPRSATWRRRSRWPLR